MDQTADVEWRSWPLDPRYRVGSDGTVLGVRGGPLKHTIDPKWGYCLIVVRLADGRRICTTRHRIVLNYLLTDRFVGTTNTVRQQVHEPTYRRLREIAGDGTLTGDDVAEALAELGTLGAELDAARAAIAAVVDAWRATTHASVWVHDPGLAAALDQLDRKSLAGVILEDPREVERTSRDYVDAVDRGREMDIPNLGKPVLQFQRMRAALGGYPTLADADAPCEPGEGCNAPADPAPPRIAELEAENAQLRRESRVATELLAALREQGVCIPVLPSKAAQVRSLRPVSR